MNSIVEISRRSWLCAVALLVVGCGGGGGNGAPSGTAAAPPGNVAAVSSENVISLLFMGNSHTSANELTKMVATMVQAVRPSKTVLSTEAPGWMFLDARLQDKASMDLLRGQRWSAVVLQAQKYSTSGQFTYSTAEAEEIIRIVRSIGGMPIMFPEWPRRGVDETQRVYDLHVSIVQKQAACVAPIGQAWDLALARDPTLVLHAEDGNHSAPAGAFLAALVLFATLTNESPLRVPELAQFGVSAAIQAQLRAIAAETVQTIPPRQWCASDPAL